MRLATHQIQAIDEVHMEVTCDRDIRSSYHDHFHHLCLEEGIVVSDGASGPSITPGSRLIVNRLIHLSPTLTSTCPWL